MSGCLVVALAGGAYGQVASALLLEDGPIPGGPAGQTVGSLNNTAVNHAGGYACSLNSEGKLGTLSMVWGNASGGAGAVLRTESTIGNLEQTSFESFYGISNSGQVSYSATCVDTITGETSIDTVWLDDAPVAVENQPVASLPGQFWSFASRPGTTAGGTPYWVGGIKDSVEGNTQNRGLFFGLGATKVLLGGDIVPGLPFPIDCANGVSFDYRYSAAGNHYSTEIQMESGSSSNDNAMVQNDAGLMLGGGLVREDDPVPESIGGLPGEVWDNFDFTGITEAGDYFFTGDTNDVDSGLDEIMVVNGVIARREGDVIDGEVVSGSIEGAYMNEQGDCAYIWDIQDNSLEALFFNGELLLQEGDAVDIDGDGVIDPGTAITSFTGISTLTCSDRDAEGMVNIYFTADVDIEATGEELEGFFCLRTQGVECFLVVASAPGQSDFTSGAHVFKTQLADSISSHAVLTNDIPEFKLSQFGVSAERDTPFAKLGGKKKKELQLPSSFAVQVMMWNPYEFPAKPEQWTQGLYVVVEPNGRVRGLPYGDSSGMTIWAETDVNDEGEPVVRFPFSINGD